MEEQHEQPTARWQKLKAVFAQARALDGAEREAFLAETTDEALRNEVRALLTADAASGPLDDLMAAVMAPIQEKLSDSFFDKSPAEVQIGPYEVVQELGRGGMGRVYKARDPRLDRFVALKLLAPHLSAHPTAKERFMQEARAASALDHPNICTIYEIDETDEGGLYIAMACYDQPTLAEQIRRGPLSIETSLDIAIQVADGLACAHAADIVHRDVKPSNLVVTERGDVKILDFGVAKLERRTDLTGTGARLGTVAYMAPEQVRGDDVDPRADLWALGVVLYEMLTGQRPFQGDTDAALIYALLEDEPPPITVHRSDAPAELDGVVQRALSKAPDDRYPGAKAMREALRAIRRGETRSVVAPPSTSLPTALTSFIGRTKEVEQVEALLADARLVTLTGPAGTGKTRLGLHVTERMADTFDHGVDFVSLASVTDPGLVASTIAQALDFEPPGAMSPMERLKRGLQNQDRLLVLDNFEQVAAAASVIAELLRACPRLRVLATSRVPLHVSGEQEVPVPPLDLPDALEGDDLDAVQAAPAVALFVERARAVDPDFALTSENAPAVAELCQRLDGLPLAIELAAARVKLLAPQALLTRLEGRLDLLTGGPRDHPERHQTLRHAIAWSYDLLDEAHRQLFRRLAVFVGGCTLEAIEAVGRDVPLDRVAALVDHSLLRREPGPEGEPRFSMLETIRAYGIEQLEQHGDLDTARRAHALYVLDVAEQAAGELTGADQAAWLNRLESEHGNLRVALRWALDQGEDATALRLGAALWRFWLVRGHLIEGRQWLETILAATDPSVAPMVRAQVLNAMGTFAHNQGDNREARNFLQDGLRLWRALDDEQGQAGRPAWRGRRAQQPRLGSALPRGVPGGEPAPSGKPGITSHAEGSSWGRLCVHQRCLGANVSRPLRPRRRAAGRRLGRRAGHQRRGGADLVAVRKREPGPPRGTPRQSDAPVGGGLDAVDGRRQSITSSADTGRHRPCPNRSGAVR